ncbi:hypothetical protein MHYP_G00341720 [Metynnis hypsauchen]
MVWEVRLCEGERKRPPPAGQEEKWSMGLNIHLFTLAELHSHNRLVFKFHEHDERTKCQRAHSMLPDNWSHWMTGDPGGSHHFSEEVVYASLPATSKGPAARHLAHHLALLSRWVTAGSYAEKESCRSNSYITILN